MSPEQAALPCVLFAVRRESMVFRRLFPPMERVNGAPCPALLVGERQRPILLLETGVGRAAVEAALQWLSRAPYRPRVLIYAGFAGALHPDWRVGDVLLADTIVNETGECWATWRPTQPLRLRNGRLLTVDRLVATPAEKRMLGATHDTPAVDMEAAHVARWCARQEWPFGCMRAISDDADTALSPELVAVLAGGRVSMRRIGAALLRRPGLLAELLRLQRSTRQAARQLAVALQALLLTSTEPPGLHQPGQLGESRPSPRLVP